MDETKDSHTNIQGTSDFTSQEINNGSVPSKEFLKTNNGLRAKAKKNWIILISLNFQVAFWGLFFQPGFIEFLVKKRSAYMYYGDDSVSFLDVFFAILGAFGLMIMIPVLIAGIHRLITKKPSPPTLFGFYYLIFFGWSFHRIYSVVTTNIYFGYNPLNMFKDPVHLDLLAGTSFILTVTYGAIYFIYWYSKRYGSNK